MENREIKFRAWNETEKRYSKPFGLFQTVLNYTDDDGLGVIKSITNEKVEQFTGLQDKNGVNIYEGDIVQSTKEDWSFSDGFSIDDKRWEDYNTGKKQIPIIVDVTDIVVMDRFPLYWLKKERFGYEGEDLQTPENFEIIGNIHES